ncbi:recombinase family protein [Patescibacteria group bacterium]|nr:recombinase family protein [Patescibacteria group bacterium]
MKYILYCRKSTEDKGRQVLSLDSQINEMRKIADNLGLKIEREFRESKSAKMPDNRPLFSEMITYIQKNKKESYGVLCWKIDRLSRNPIDSATVQWLLQQGKIKVIQTADRQYLPSDNVLLFNVESSMANQYILDLSKNVKRGIIAKLEQGGFPNFAPVGYINDKANKTIVIDKERDRYIRKAFEMYASSNHSLKDITNTLYDEGFRSRGGNKIHKSKIHYLLSNPIYCGIIEKDGKKYIGNHKPIISKKLFDDVQKVAQLATRPKTKKLYFMYRGVLKCSKCGCAMTASKKKGKHIYYYCTNGKGKCNEHKVYLKEEKASEEMAKAFKEVKFDERLINLCYKAKMEELEANDDYLTQAQDNLKKQLEAVSKRKNALLDLFIDGKIEKDIYDNKNNLLNNEEVEIKKELSELKSKIGNKGKETLERIKEVFLYPVNKEKTFLEIKDEKKEEVIKALLWNAQFENQKIAHFSFKEPYNILSKVSNKSDFSQLLRDRDSNPD